MLLPQFRREGEEKREGKVRVGEAKREGELREEKSEGEAERLVKLKWLKWFKQRSDCQDQLTEKD